MERVKSTRSSTPSEADDSEKRRSMSEPLQPPLVLRVALRPLRVFVLTVLAITSLSVLIVYLNQGFVVLHFNKAGKTTKQLDKLVDRYNSYAANFATMLGKPTELFVTAAVQVFMLRFLSAQMLRAEPDRRLGLLALALSTGVGYMISNGFGAVNVQLRDTEVQPVILATDLSNTKNSSVAAYLSAATTVDNSVPESQTSNPVVNTVLRTLVTPREPKTLPWCDLASETADFKDFVQDDVLQFGMPQREWMEYMLPKALESKRQRVMINATDKNANANVKAADMPMDASVAANLFLHSMFLSSQYLPWGRNTTWESNATESTSTERKVSTAVLMGALPTDLSASEQTKREWFLRESGPLLSRLVAGGTAGMSTTDISMELSHTELSRSATFDALTFEIDVDPELYTTSRDEKNNETRYLDLDKYQCLPWPGRCLLHKNGSRPLVGASKTLYDAPMLVHAFAMCLDANGTEALQSSTWYSQDFGVRDCTRTSSSSMLLVSVAKRLVADALVQNVSIPTENEPKNVTRATNVRKIYTFTVGRLGWKLQNLSSEFRASCNVDVLDGCMGLTRDLSDQRVAVIGASWFSVPLLTPIYPTFNANQRPLRLVQITEPPIEGDNFQYNTIAGDFLFPHNVKNFTWDLNYQPSSPKECSAYQEDRVRNVLSNHMYMETTLQSTYTAGMFFLFQDAVAQEVLWDDVQVAGVTDGKLTLKFEGNVYKSGLWLSTPLQNTLLTLGGCAVLALSLFSGLLYSIYGRVTHKPDPLANITSPHVIARAMLDESQFPSLLLHRRVTDARGEYKQKTVKDLQIQNLLLQSQEISSGDTFAA